MKIKYLSNETMIILFFGNYEENRTQIARPYLVQEGVGQRCDSNRGANCRNKIYQVTTAN